MWRVQSLDINSTSQENEHNFVISVFKLALVPMFNETNPIKMLSQLIPSPLLGLDPR